MSKPFPISKNNKRYSPRILREGDLSSLLDLEMQSFPIDHWSKEIFLSELKNKNAVIKVLKCEGKVVGYIHTEFSDRQFGGKKIRVGEIGSLAVAQDHRGKKLGEKLMRHGLRSLKKNDTSTIVLQTRLDNVIVKSMAENKFGFKVSKVLKNFYSDRSPAYEMILHV